MSDKKKGITRRKFIGQASCAAIGFTTLYSSLLNLRAIGAAAMDNSAMPPGEYKGLVCLLQAGGNDSFNMLMPRSGDAYNQYSITRSNLAIPQNEILPINPLNPDGQQYGIHPAMPEVQELFDQQKLSFISNVGTLIEPTTKEQFQSGIHPLPLGLFSHADQIQQWQTGRPHERSAYGWAGRMTDLIQSMNSNENISMNISLSGTNVFQHGPNAVEYVISSQGATGIEGYGGDWYDAYRTQAIDNMLDAEYEDIYKKTYVNTIRNSNQATMEFQEAIAQVPPFQTQFSDNEISQSFAMIAKVIAAREILGFSRQTFFVNSGGWDHHDEVLDNQSEMLPLISKALSEFNSAMEELGISEDVTTFSISDFARTLTSNGNGTDHAWGGNVMVMGGSVNGGQIFGSYPFLELDGPLDVGNGVLIPTISVDEYLSELALWFGVSPSELNSIFPNLVNFYDPASPNLPIGFLST